MLVPVDGGEPRQLFSLGVREDMRLKAKFSPDGQAVAYSREKDGQPGVFLFVMANRLLSRRAAVLGHSVRPSQRTE